MSLYFCFSYVTGILPIEAFECWLIGLSIMLCSDSPRIDTQGLIRSSSGFVNVITIIAFSLGRILILNNFLFRFSIGRGNLLTSPGLLNPTQDMANIVVCTNTADQLQTLESLRLHQILASHNTTSRLKGTPSSPNLRIIVSKQRWSQTDLHVSFVRRD